MDDLTNRQIEKYRVLGRHASGGFSVLWKAHYANNKRKYVVIKLMLPEKAKSRSDRPLFEREFKICRSFDHPSLLKYHSYGVHDSLPYLVMDFFDGKNLKTLIAERSELVRGQAGRIAGAAAAGLAYIHAQGIVHRDIKPENILVAADGGARLIDFSIAQTKWQRLNPFDRGLHGTPSYLSPEVVQGKRAGPASDIYALGAVLFEMLAGRPPFTGDSDKQVLQKHVKEAPPRLSRFNPEISTKLDKLVASMLAKDPAARPGDAAELASRLGKMAIYVET